MGEIESERDQGEQGKEGREGVRDKGRGRGKEEGKVREQACG